MNEPPPKLICDSGLCGVAMINNLAQKSVTTEQEVKDWLLNIGSMISAGGTGFTRPQLIAYMEGALGWQVNEHRQLQIQDLLLVKRAYISARNFYYNQPSVLHAIAYSDGYILDSLGSRPYKLERTKCVSGLEGDYELRPLNGAFESEFISAFEVITGKKRTSLSSSSSSSDESSSDDGFIEKNTRPVKTAWESGALNGWEMGPRRKSQPLTRKGRYKPY